MESISQIAQAFTKMFKQHSIHFSHVRPVLQAFLRLPDKGTLAQKISIITNLAHFFQIAVSNQRPAIQKLKNDVFYGFLQASSKNERRANIIKTKRPARQKRRGGPEMTLNEILEQAVAQGLNQMNMQTSVVPQKQEGIQEAGLLSVTVPPFGPEIIAQLTQSASIFEKTSKKSSQMLEWQPNKLENYQRWLALTQHNINIAHTEKNPRTKKRNVVRKQCIKDEKIDISQETDQMALIEKLETKIKLSRQPYHKHQCTFQSFYEQINADLVDIDSIRTTLALKLNQNRKKYVRSFERHLNEDSFHNSFETNHNEMLNASKTKSLSDSQTRMDDLGEKLKKLIDEWLLLEKSISFSQLCRSRALSGEVKGDVFCRLLSCPFELQQRDVTTFGEIYVSAKVE